MTPLHAALGVLVGFVAGVLAGMFGVGGGIVATPGISVIFGASPLVAVATPLPVIFPTAIIGADAYRRAGEIDLRAAAWISIPGVAASAAGAALTDVIDGHLLLVVTAALLAWQGVRVAQGTSTVQGEERAVTAGRLAGIGLLAGAASGLLGIGGGIVIVPMLVGWLGMPLKRALGTSLAAIVALVIPGTIVHAALGHIDWAIALVLAIGSVAGVRVGAKLALGARERTLRLIVGAFLGTVAVAYGVSEALSLAGGRR